MVNKDQLEQTSEGKQVLALMAEHFTDEQFQPALTLIEQLYTEDLTVWDAGLNTDSKLPFNRTSPAERLLVFFNSSDALVKVKDELQQREAEHARQVEEAAAQQAPVQQVPIRKARAKSKTTAKRGGVARKSPGKKARAVKTTRKRSPARRRTSLNSKRAKKKKLPAKATRLRGKKSHKTSKSKRR